MCEAREGLGRDGASRGRRPAAPRPRLLRPGAGPLRSPSRPGQGARVPGPQSSVFYPRSSIPGRPRLSSVVLSSPHLPHRRPAVLCFQQVPVAGFGPGPDARAAAASPTLCAARLVFRPVCLGSCLRVPSTGLVVFRL